MGRTSARAALPLPPPLDALMSSARPSFLNGRAFDAAANALLMWTHVDGEMPRGEFQTYSYDTRSVSWIFISPILALLGQFR